MIIRCLQQIRKVEALFTNKLLDAHGYLYIIAFSALLIVTICHLLYLLQYFLAGLPFIQKRQNDKLIAANPSDNRAGEILLQNHCNSEQSFITFAMPEQVIDLLQVIHIRKGQEGRFAQMRWQTLLHFLEKTIAVIQPCKRIRGCLLLKTMILFLKHLQQTLLLLFHENMLQSRPHLNTDRKQHVQILDRMSFYSHDPIMTLLGKNIEICELFPFFSITQTWHIMPCRTLLEHRHLNMMPFQRTR